MVLSESFQVIAIIEKLPPAWIDFKIYLKHKRKEMSVEDLIRRLRIEEDNKSAESDPQIPMLPRLIWWSMKKTLRGRSLSPSQGPN